MPNGIVGVPLIASYRERKRDLAGKNAGVLRAPWQGAQVPLYLPWIHLWSKLVRHGILCPIWGAYVLWDRTIPRIMEFFAQQKSLAVELRKEWLFLCSRTVKPVASYCLTSVQLCGIDRKLKYVKGFGSTILLPMTGREPFSNNQCDYVYIILCISCILSLFQRNVSVGFISDRHQVSQTPVIVNQHCV